MSRMRGPIDDAEVATGGQRRTRAKAHFRAVVLVASMGLGLSYVAAQELAPPADRSADEQPSDDDELPVVTTPEEQVAQSEAIFATGTSIRDEVQSMLSAARRERDVIRIT